MADRAAGKWVDVAVSDVFHMPCGAERMVWKDAYVTASSLYSTCAYRPTSGFVTMRRLAESTSFPS